MNPFYFQNNENTKRNENINNFYDIPEHNRTSMKNKKNDWKKIVTNKLIDRIKSSRKERMSKLFEKKYEFLEEIKTLNLTTDINEVNEYISKIWNLFHNNYDEYQSENFGIELNFKTSVCPICSYPVIAINDRVFCTKGCINLLIPSNCFWENLTLDNLMDKYLETLRNHIECNSEIIPIIADEGLVIFSCKKCFEREINSIFNN